MSFEEEPDKVPDTEDFLLQLQDLIENARKLPMSASVSVNRDDFIAILNDALVGFPEEIREARWLLKEREAVIDRARAEADRLIEAARVRAARMVEKDEMVREARRTAEQILEDAAVTQVFASAKIAAGLKPVTEVEVIVPALFVLLASSSRQRTGLASTFAKSSTVSGRSSCGAVTEVMRVTCERISTPTAFRNAFASAPPATRAAVSRALARSRMLRTSPVRYFHVPTRSAWPGRGRWTSGISLSTGHGFIRSSQFA